MKIKHALQEYLPEIEVRKDPPKPYSNTAFMQAKATVMP